jgi:ribosomal protein S18 acetylase RimI-like enzyme
MGFLIRPARAEDVPLIAAWTRDTFSWGDYVPDQVSDWISDPTSQVVVCVYEDDVPVALSRAQMLSSTEAWLSGARVHPGHRRSGMGSAMNDHGVDWARSQGALVARLATEEENRAARSQVLKSGYRLTGRWMHATGPAGGQRDVAPGRRLHLGTSLDADAAWMFWSQSELEQTAHELMPHGWRWRKASRADLEEAVASHAFYQGAAGWAIVRPVEGGLAVRWIAATPADAPLLLQGIRDLAEEEGLESVEAMVPAAPWLVEALRREGFELHPVVIYSKSL